MKHKYYEYNEAIAKALGWTEIRYYYSSGSSNDPRTGKHPTNGYRYDIPNYVGNRLLLPDIWYLVGQTVKTKRLFLQYLYDSEVHSENDADEPRVNQFWSMIISPPLRQVEAALRALDLWKWEWNLKEDFGESIIQESNENLEN